MYDKWVHLLTVASFKAKLSMGTGKLFKAPLAFQQKKIQPSFEHGLRRTELSNYFSSKKDWDERSQDFSLWEQRITSVEEALYSMEETLVYQINFKVFWDSFWFAVDNATVLVVFEPDLWTVAYAYSERSYLFTGNHTDKHNKSGDRLTFLQRFAGKKTLV